MTPYDTRVATRLIMLLFALQPMAFGAWLAAIPYVKESLALSKAELALALLGMPLALIPTLQFAAGVVSRIGPRKTFAWILPVQACAFVLPFVAIGQGSLFAALALAGAVLAFLEVGLNVYAGRLEKAANLVIMSRCHGFWALGVALGSFLATQLFFIGVFPAVLLVGVMSAMVGIGAGLNLPRLAGQAEAMVVKRQKLHEMPRALFLISFFVLFVTMAEGAMSDWAAVFLAERWASAPEDAGIAVTVFATFLAGGRFVGDYLKKRLGARGLARLTVGLAIVGVGCLTLWNSIMLTFTGFALIGLGVSVGFPLGISASAMLDDIHEAQYISTMSMIAICGFLIGPPVIGFVGELISLRVALMLLVPGLCVSFYLTRVFPNTAVADSKPESE